MNDCYLIIKDVDGLICSYLTPPHLLSLSAVNTHYRQLLKHQTDQFNYIKTDLDRAIKSGSLQMVQWILNKEKYAKRFLKQISDSELYGFLKSCKKGHIDIVGYLIDFVCQYDNGEYYISICDIVNEGIAVACEYNHLAIAKRILELECVRNRQNEFEISYNMAFVYACKGGNIAIAKWLLESGKNINIHNGGERPFISACINGKIDIVKMLIKLGEDSGDKIDIHYWGEDAFRHACANGHLDIARLLLKLGEDSYGRIDIHAHDEDAFVSACDNGHLHILQWLIELGEDTYGPINIRAVHAKHFEYGNIFGLACTKGHLSVAKYLIELGAGSYGQFDIQTNANTLFITVCKNGQMDMVKWFMTICEQFGIDIDIHADDEDAFRSACANGHIAVAQWLISVGEQSGAMIDIHVEDDEPFASACANGHIAVAKWLISIGEQSYGRINIDTGDILNTLFADGYYEIIDFLIELGLSGTYDPVDTWDHRIRVFEFLLDPTRYAQKHDYDVDRLIKFFEYDQTYKERIDIHYFNVINGFPLVFALSHSVEMAQVLVDMHEKGYIKPDLDEMNSGLFEKAENSTRKMSFVINLNKKYYGQLNITREIHKLLKKHLISKIDNMSDNQMLSCALKLRDL